MKTVTIERLGHQGDGIAAGPVFVPRTLPGEVVAGAVDGDRISTPKIVTPVPERVQPTCRHYKNCGGCALQHASNSFVENWKKNVVITALQAQGLSVPIRQIHTSPPHSRRRATIASRRTKKGAQAGFHGAQSDVICEIDDCQLLRPELLQMLPYIRDLTSIGASRKGRLAVTLTLLENGLDVSVKGGKPMDGQLFSQLSNLSRDTGNIARLSWEEEVVAEFSPPQLCLGKAVINPPPGTFLQATVEGQAALQAAVTEAVGGAKSIADLFAGCGTFALPLAEQARVHAVEGSGDMMASLLAGWRGAVGLKPVSTEARDLFQRPLLPDELNDFDAIVIDPPRAGAEAQVNQVANSQVPVIAMVSCNPVTFARDVRVLTEAGFSVEWIDVVDQFRWSTHVEIVARLTRAA